jgi:hypothetical protein
MTTFCKLDGPLEVALLEGGPRGGNGLDDIDAFEGLVMAEELLRPWFELCPELMDEGLECEADPDPIEVEPRELTEDWQVSDPSFK